MSLVSLLNNVAYQLFPGLSGDWSFAAATQRYGQSQTTEIILKVEGGILHHILTFILFFGPVEHLCPGINVIPQQS